MPKILSFHHSPELEKENPFKYVWEEYKSLDKFSKLFVITFLLIVLSTPFIVGNYQIFNSHGQEIQQVPQVPKVISESVSTTDQILVKFKPGVSKIKEDEVIQTNGVFIIGDIPQIKVKILKVNNHAQDAVIKALSHHATVDFAEPNELVKPQIIPNDPLYSSAWHHIVLQSPSAWDKAKAGGVLMGICDTGFDSTNPDLAPVLRVDLGYNTADGSTNWSDVVGHGTAVAGAAAAATNNSIGVSGVAWGAMIIPIRITSNTTSGAAYVSDAVKCITYAADHGARAINLSYLMAGYSTIDSAGQYAQGKGAVTTVAAGNDAIDPGWPNFPGFLAVSATNSIDNLATYSNHGAFVDIAAPGSTIMTTQMYNVVTYPPDGYYGTSSGTSLASPVAAGVLGLIFGANPSLSAAQAQDVLFKSSDDLGSAGWDPYFGWGRVNANKAVVAALAVTPDTQAPTVNITTPSSGATVTGPITVSVSATDNVGISKVELYLDGAFYATDTTSPYDFYWDTATVVNGSHILSAKAYDAANNVGISSAITVTVNNASPTPTIVAPTLTPLPSDTIPPTVSITSPLNNAIVTRNSTVTITATASDNIGVTKVEFLVNNSLICTDTTFSYSCSWKVSGKPNASYTIMARAYDASNNVASSPIVTVTSK